MVVLGEVTVPGVEFVPVGAQLFVPELVVDPAVPLVLPPVVPVFAVLVPVLTHEFVEPFIVPVEPVVPVEFVFVLVVPVVPVLVLFVFVLPCA